MGKIRLQHKNGSNEKLKPREEIEAAFTDGHM